MVHNMIQGPEGLEERIIFFRNYLAKRGGSYVVRLAIAHAAHSWASGHTAHSNKIRIGTRDLKTVVIVEQS